MRHRKPQSQKERAARSALRKVLADESAMIRGSLVVMKRSCGKGGCKCAKGEKHVSLYLAVRLEGRRRMIYVPKALEEKARRWVREGREVDGRIDDLSQAALELFLAEKQAAAAERRTKRARKDRGK